MKKANDLMPASRRFVNAARIFCSSSRLTMSLRSLGRRRISMPIASIQQPDLRSRWTNAGSVRLSARALPNQRMSRLRAISSSQKALNVFAFSVTVSPQR